MRGKALALFFISAIVWSAAPQAARAEVSTLYSQSDDSGEMLSQQPTFQYAWISSASLGNLFLGKGPLFLTFSMKDSNAGDTLRAPVGVALGTCETCQDLQIYFFTDADRALLSDRAFHTFRVETGATPIGLADGTNPIYIQFFGLSQYRLGTHVKSDAAGAIPYLLIEGTPPIPPVSSIALSGMKSITLDAATVKYEPMIAGDAITFVCGRECFRKRVVNTIECSYE